MSFPDQNVQHAILVRGLSPLRPQCVLTQTMFATDYGHCTFPLHICNGTAITIFLDYTSCKDGVFCMQLWTRYLSCATVKANAAPSGSSLHSLFAKANRSIWCFVDILHWQGELPFHQPGVRPARTTGTCLSGHRRSPAQALNVAKACIADVIRRILLEEVFHHSGKVSCL